MQFAHDSLESEMTSNESRYEGQPMLRLMDSYVLDAIGLLDEQYAATLREQAPKLATVFGVQAETWQSIVEQAMHMPPDSQETVVRAWNTYQREYSEHGEAADPVEFAHTMVDRALGAGDD